MLALLTPPEMITVDVLLAVLSFGLICFSVGYAIGAEIYRKHRSDRPCQGKQSLFVIKYSEDNRPSVVALYV